MHIIIKCLSIFIYQVTLDETIQSQARIVLSGHEFLFFYFNWCYVIFNKWTGPGRSRRADQAPRIPDPEWTARSFDGQLPVARAGFSLLNTWVPWPLCQCNLHCWCTLAEDHFAVLDFPSLRVPPPSLFFPPCCCMPCNTLAPPVVSLALILAGGRSLFPLGILRPVRRAGYPPSCPAPGTRPTGRTRTGPGPVGRDRFTLCAVTLTVTAARTWSGSRDLGPRGPRGVVSGTVARRGRVEGDVSPRIPRPAWGRAGMRCSARGPAGTWSSKRLPDSG